MLLLKEVNEQLEYIKETAEDGSKNYYLKGIFMVGEAKNRNNRWYPMSLLRREATKYNENYVSQRRAFGELNHPTTPTINLNLVSHLITELKESANTYVGKAKVLNNTPNGKIVKALMDEGCKLGISSRGLGALKEENGTKYVTEYIITTAGDIVADPSAPGAFLENVVESVEWFFDGVNWTRQENAVHLVEEFKQKKRQEREEQFLNMFEKLLTT